MTKPPSSGHFSPLTFCPIFQERVWGGRKIATVYGKSLPAGTRIGESWEIADRPEAQTLVAAGEFQGKSLSWLIERYPAEILGSVPPTRTGRFPLLLKILDAQEPLSLQVHPPPAVAALLAGEPKSELWYIADASPNACIYAGLKDGVTAGHFGTVASSPAVIDLCRRHEVQEGDAIFLPSGVLHAIGGGTLIFEIQQNSDTTYRVFDWARASGGEEKRRLHLREAMQSIDFAGNAPRLLRTSGLAASVAHREPLLRDPLFDIDLLLAPAGAAAPLPPGGLQILAVVKGQIHLDDPQGRTDLRAGGFALIPAAAGPVTAHFSRASRVLHILPH